MIRHGIAKRYAKALYGLDRERVKDFSTLFAFFQREPKVLQLLRSPLVTEAEKEALLTQALKERVAPIFLHFLFFVMKKKRINSLKEIFVEYELLVDAQAGMWEAELISRGPLPPSTRNELLDKLERSFNKKIALREESSDDIVGGTLFILGNQEIDWRVETRLDKIKKHLLGIDVCR
ncbi:MAG: ATP synthase F1 subunit delta [Verrucomicrobia bacterium]|nr:ATP synthase F1 subunit delta [Verrucomicrobiota bacterium]MBS0636109.1 ATP synthase F1 subunit delta [Verrucomicrobiota bacterium]